MRHRVLWACTIVTLVAACAPKDPGASSPDAQSTEPAATTATGPAATTEPEPSAASPVPPAAPVVERSFVPLSRVTETWGGLRLSNQRAQFAAFDGEMRLEHAGAMPDAAGPELAGAQVYRITNAEDFFARNAGRNAFCSEPPRWLAVRAVAAEGRPGNEFWVAFITAEDWSSYRPELAGYCGGGLYAP
jgi:hypothetical protein